MMMRERLAWSLVVAVPVTIGGAGWLLGHATGWHDAIDKCTAAVADIKATGGVTLCSESPSNVYIGGYPTRAFNPDYERIEVVARLVPLDGWATLDPTTVAP